MISIRKYYIGLVIVIALLTFSGCAFNKLFLAPFELSVTDEFKNYHPEFEDTLILSFTDSRSPIVHDSKDNLVDFEYSLENIFFKNRHEDSLNAWLFTPDNFNGTTIYFLHGNAGNVVYQYPLVHPFVKAGYRLFLLDYSGFGFSQGKSKRKNVITDANDGLAFLLEYKDLDIDHLLIYGQSLGGHLAAVVATQNQAKIDGVIIEGAFSSHKDIASDKVPFLGRIFTREMYSAKKNIPFMQKPVLVIHSTEDQTIPYEQGLIIFNAATEPKTMLTIDKPHIRGPLFYADTICSLMNEMIRQD